MMSRQQGMDVTYNRSRLTIGIVIGLVALGVLIAPVFLVWFNRIFQPVQPNEFVVPTINPSRPAAATPTPIEILDLTTPTPLPTLSQDQRQQLYDELLKITTTGTPIPSEALDEILNPPTE